MSNNFKPICTACTEKLFILFHYSATYGGSIQHPRKAGQSCNPCFSPGSGKFHNFETANITKTILI